MKKRHMFWITILLFIFGIVLFVNFHPVFWSESSNLERSSNFKDGKFQNMFETIMQTGDKGFWWMMKDYITNDEEKYPEKVITTHRFDKNKFREGDFVWFWHSTLLTKQNNKNIIIDPVFYNASPVFFGWKSFNYSNPPKVSDLPKKLDIVLITHDHYDHLDYKVILEIDSNVEKYLVPLWVDAHLIGWWVDKQKIETFDWYDSVKIDNIEYIFTPSQHFSWRGLMDRFSTLWWAWIVKTDKSNIFFSWDSGYFSEFKNIWEKYWPFDIAFVENWAYNESWASIHMMPEEVVQTWIDLKAKQVMPIHWWKFDLSLHSWYEPIERFKKQADKQNLKYLVPMVWETFSITNNSNKNWWRDFIK